MLSELGSLQAHACPGVPVLNFWSSSDLVQLGLDVGQLWPVYWTHEMLVQDSKTWWKPLEVSMMVLALQANHGTLLYSYSYVARVKLNSESVNRCLWTDSSVQHQHPMLGLWSVDGVLGYISLWFLFCRPFQWNTQDVCLWLFIG